MDYHITNLIGPAFLISIVVNLALNVLSWISSMFTIGEKNVLIGMDSLHKETKTSKDLQYTLFFGYLTSISMKIRILFFYIVCFGISG